MFEFDREKLKKTGLLFALFLVFTLLVRFVDVRAIGPEGSSVGFAAVNGLAAKLIGYHPFWYKVAEVLGYISILFCLFFAFMGIRQLLEAQGRFSLIDNSYFALGIIYLITIAFYEVFNKVVVNYRPIILDAAEGLEASYPSSHTVLAVVVMLTAAMQFRRLLPKGDQRKPLLLSICYLLMAATVLARFLSGAHWLTDIAGGLLLAAAIVSLYDSVIKPDPQNAMPARQSRTSSRKSGRR